MTPLEIIKSFVDGSLPPAEFERMLNNDAALHTALEASFTLPAYINEPDLYTFLIGQQYANIESVFNVQVILSDFLKSQGVEHVPSKKYEELFNLLLKVQPKWLALPFDYLSALLERAPSQQPKALQAWLKETIASEFRCLKSAPKWLQAPAWPIENGKPLVFVGQLDVSALSHDSSQAYVFFDETTGTFQTLKQSC